MTAWFTKREPLTFVPFLHEESGAIARRAIANGTTKPNAAASSSPSSNHD